MFVRVPLLLSTVLVVGLLPSGSALGQARKYRSITWETFKAADPGLKQIGTVTAEMTTKIQNRFAGILDEDT